VTDLTDLTAPIRARVEAATALGEWETTRANDVVIYAYPCPTVAAVVAALGEGK
jgi:hypothetical protein